MISLLGDNFDVFDNSAYNNKSLFSFAQSTSFEDCLMKCDESALCVTFNYDKTSKACEMFSQNATSSINMNKMSSYKIKADLQLIGRLGNGKKKSLINNFSID